MPEKNTGSFESISEERFTIPTVVFNNIDFTEHMLSSGAEGLSWNTGSRDCLSYFWKEDEGNRKEVECEERRVEERRAGHVQGREQRVHTYCREVTWPRKSLCFTLKPANI